MRNYNGPGWQALKEVLSSGRYYSRLEMAHGMCHLGSSAPVSKSMGELRRHGGVCVKAAWRGFYTSAPTAEECVASMQRVQNNVMGQLINQLPVVEYCRHNHGSLVRQSTDQVMKFIEGLSKWIRCMADTGTKAEDRYRIETLAG